MDNRKICGRARAEAIGGLAAWGKNQHSGLSGEDIMAELEIYEKIGLLDCLGESCGMHALCQGKSMVSGDIKLREAVLGLL